MLPLQRQILILFRSENKNFVAINLRDKSSKIALLVKEESGVGDKLSRPSQSSQERLGLRKLACKTSRTIASCEKVS